MITRMSLGGGGAAGRGGYNGVGYGVGAAGGFRGGAVGGTGGVRDRIGLNPYRPRGFGSGDGSTRVETPSLNQMRAKQGAIVAKFMTFFKRKSTLVVEMYETAFYRQKPNWDRIAEFIHTDLCPTAELRKAVKDVQFHPVKMLLFIKCSEERYRDEIVMKIQSEQGVVWSDYRVRVKGYSLDAQVKFIRLLGVSPETTEDEIRTTFRDENIGEVMDLKKGLLDATRLPGVTNGTWTMRVRIADAEKIIPSYIHRRDEGELWSLNFEGRVFCCWKCGNGSHIGDKCRDQSRTFEEIFGGVDSVVDEFVKPTWAAVVRSGNGENEAHASRVKEMERKVREENLRKDQERIELEAVKQREDAEIELHRMEDLQVRQKALDEASAKARLLKEQEDNDSWSASDVADMLDQSVTNSSLVHAVTDQAGKCGEPAVKFIDRSLLTAIRHRSWLEARAACRQNEARFSLTLDPRLDLALTVGMSSRLAIEYQGSSGGIDAIKSDQYVDESVADEAVEVDIPGTSTPKRQRTGGKRRGRETSPRSESLSPVEGIDGDLEEGFEVDLLALGSSFITDDESSVNSESENQDSKKLKMDDFEFDGDTSPGEDATEDYMDTGKDDVSVVEVSSEVSGDAHPAGTSDGGPGGV